MARPQSPARQCATELANAGVPDAIIRTAIGESFPIHRTTLARIMNDTKIQVATLETVLERLKRIAIRAETEGNHSAAIAAHRAIRETLRELRLARSFEELEDGNDALTW